MILDRSQAVPWQDLRFVLDYPKEKQKKLAKLTGFTSFEQWQDYINRGHEIVARMYAWDFPKDETEKQERLREIRQSPEVMYRCWIRVNGEGTAFEQFLELMEELPL